MENFEAMVERHAAMKVQLAMTELEAAALHLMATIEEARKIMRGMTYREGGETPK